MRGYSVNIPVHVSRLDFLEKWMPRYDECIESEALRKLNAEGVAMKSRLSKTPNERMELISITALVVGIDIAKEKHVAYVTKFRGFVLASRAAWMMSSLAWRVQATTDSISHWLVQQGIDVVLVPMITKRNKDNRDNPPFKSDYKDALVIADAVSRCIYTRFSKGEAFQRIRVTVTNRDHWVVESGRIENRVHRWPELKHLQYAYVGIARCSSR